MVADEIISHGRTSLAQNQLILPHLPLIEDFLTTLIADDVFAGAADDLGDGLAQLDGLVGEELSIGHTLVAEEVALPFILGFRGILLRGLAAVGVGGNAYGRFCSHIHKRSRHLAVILNTHCALSHPAVGGHRNAIGTAPIRFHDCQQAFVALRQFQPQQVARKQTHAYAEYLPGTEMFM